MANEGRVKIELAPIEELRQKMISRGSEGMTNETV